MTSLNSQESSNDIAKLTDKQQAEYRNAYQEYIAQMAQLEMSGVGERPVQPQPGQFMTSSACDKGKDAAEPDGRKPLNKRGGGKLPADAAEFASAGGVVDALDPITEEDEKSGSSKSLLTRKLSAERGGLFQGAGDLKVKATSGGLRYQKLTSDDEESEESDNPLLKKPLDTKLPGGSLALKGKDYLSDATLDKKDSSDSGVRSNESSPNHSLQDEEADLSQLERANLIELDEETASRKGNGSGGIPSSLSGLQDPAVTRMSICSEDQCSLLASSPEESWPSSRSFNLNRTPSNVTLNNNANAQQGGRPRAPTEGPASSTTTTADVITRPGPNNENVRVVHLKRGLKPGDPPEICTVSSDTVTFSEERESIL